MSFIQTKFIRFSKNTNLDVCECEMGKKFFYQSSSIVIPTTAYDNNMLAYVLDGYYHQCNDICICSIEGICYTQSSYYALVNLVPFCEGMFSIIVKRSIKRSYLGRRVRIFKN